MLALEIEQMLTKPDYIVYNNNTKTFLNVCRNYHMWLDNMRCTDAYTALTFVYWSLQLVDVWRRYVTDNMTCLQLSDSLYTCYKTKHRNIETYTNLRCPPISNFDDCFLFVRFWRTVLLWTVSGSDMSHMPSAAKCFWLILPGSTVPKTTGHHLPSWCWVIHLTCIWMWQCYV